VREGRGVKPSPRRLTIGGPPGCSPRVPAAGDLVTPLGAPDDPVRPPLDVERPHRRRPSGEAQELGASLAIGRVGRPHPMILPVADRTHDG
jgi:hypothetical protein